MIGSFLVIWIAFFVLGGVRAYPFGGEHRHQYFLFPRLLLCATFAIDAFHARLRWNRVRGVFVVCFLVVALVATVHSLRAQWLDPPRGPPAWSGEHEVFFQDAIRAMPTYVGSFDFIGLHGSYRELGWTWLETRAGRTDVYALGPGGGWRIYRGRYLWNVGRIPASPTIAKIQNLMDEAQIEGLTAFALYLVDPGCGLPDERRGDQEQARRLFEEA